jgi:Glutathione S-transferase, N-terminal domain
MRLFVCYGTFKQSIYPSGHPCGNAYRALRDAGHEPEVIRSYGLGPLPGIFNLTPGRREVKRLTGNYWVPVLVTDDGEVVQGSRTIMEWANANPAHAADAGAVAD